MASDGAEACEKSPLQGCGTSAVSDDEISVIAVIKKGTSGIPKRARYHYIRELPLTSVKSFKNSLPKALGSIATEKSSTKSTNDVKKPRIIELSDETSKMELCKKFKMAKDEDPVESGREVIPRSPDSAEAKIIHKLPPGTVLIKQEPDTPRTMTEPRPNRSGFNTNGSSATTTTSSASSVSSCGSSSGGFGSGSRSPRSPVAKVKRVHRAPKGTGKKKTIDVIPRRNPKRSAGSKKATTAEAAVPATSTMARPRRLLATRRQEGNETTRQSSGGGRRTKPATMPYMNTRSVTRKLYTVGATYQAPTRKDETEWREWPAHGLHERPVFHPQVGIAAEYVGRVFWASPDPEGGSWAYREVMDAPEEVEVVPVDPRPNRTPKGLESSEEPFDVCMHDSLHSVLAYCAQVMAPSYRRVVAKKRRHELLEASPKADLEHDLGKEDEAASVGPEAAQIDLTELEDSSISDETLMEMSSIYKKLLPIEDRPSSLEESPSETPEGSPSSKNVKSSVEGTSSTPKNASQASEIARILSEYNESLKESGAGRPFNSTIPVAAFGDGRDSEESRSTDKTKMEDGKNTNGIDEPKKAQNPEGEDRWLEDLLVDTSLLYCIATGVPQRDLTRYVDGLDAKQSLQWLRRRDV